VFAGRSIAEAGNRLHEQCRRRHVEARWWLFDPKPMSAQTVIVFAEVWGCAGCKAAQQAGVRRWGAQPVVRKQLGKANQSTSAPVRMPRRYQIEYVTRRDTGRSGVAAVVLRSAMRVAVLSSNQVLAPP